MDTSIEKTEGQQVYIPHPNVKAQESRAILLLLFFSFLMVTLPFGAYFGTQYILNYYKVKGFDNVVWCVSVSVLTVNLIIAMYVYLAYKEQDYDAEGKPLQNKSKSD